MAALYLRSFLSSSLQSDVPLVAIKDSSLLVYIISFQAWALQITDSIVFDIKTQNSTLSLYSVSVTMKSKYAQFMKLEGDFNTLDLTESSLTGATNL